MKTFMMAAFAAVALAAAPAAAQVTDSNPTVAFTYGTGNNYNPANAVVNTTATGEQAVRLTEPFVQASATGGTGIYTFETGTNLTCTQPTAGNCSDVGFNFSFFGDAIAGATVSITNLAGGFASFAASDLDSANTSNAIQGSQRLSSAFLNGLFGPTLDINFDPNVNSTFRIDLLSANGMTTSAFAQLGTGFAATAAVPEPATWAMMLMGFGAMGFALRRNRRRTALLQMA